MISPKRVPSKLGIPALPLLNTARRVADPELEQVARVHARQHVSTPCLRKFVAQYSEHSDLRGAMQFKVIT